MKLLFLIIATILPPRTILGQTRSLSARAFEQTVHGCAPGAPINTIRAITRVESGFYPYALSVNYPTKARVRLKRQPKSLEEAISWGNWLLLRDYTLSAGLMQINIEDARRHNLSLADLFDPCKNITLGWEILTEKYQISAAHFGPGQTALLHALSMYNSGSETLGFRNGYVSNLLKKEAQNQRKGVPEQ
jgi:type IV secretion system protein VirB1